jgi:hypothetical protein
MVEMFVPAMVTRTVVDVLDAAVVASIVEGLRPTPLTRPVITAPLAKPLREGPVGLRDADDSPQAAQAITHRIAGSSLTCR